MEKLKIKDITAHLESWAPLAYQEPYDNCGLLTGDHNWNVSGILVTLDCLEHVVDEAISLQCNLIIAHHPIIFKGMKRLTGTNYVERTVIKAIKNDIAIYAIHTNLDNIHTGVNKIIAERIGLTGLEILQPKSNALLKLVTFIPKEDTDKVVDALHQAGAGHIGNYEYCSFQLEGQGSFKPTEKATPHKGKKGQLEIAEENRVEVILPATAQASVLAALRASHPYEEVAYYLSPLLNPHQEVGAGVIGDLQEALEPSTFLVRLKAQMNADCIRHTALPSKWIKRVAVCGGSGSFLLSRARAAGADAYVSADFKYHEFFDAQGDILVADPGHYESEQFTKDLIKDVLERKFPNFAVYFSKSVTNPISYL